MVLDIHTSNATKLVLQVITKISNRIAFQLMLLNNMFLVSIAFQLSVSNCFRKAISKNPSPFPPISHQVLGGGWSAIARGVLVYVCVW